MIPVQASSAGKLLAYLAHSPETRAALEAARDDANGQKRFPFPEIVRRNGDGTVAEDGAV